MISDILLVGIMLTTAIIIAIIGFGLIFLFTMLRLGEKVGREKQLRLDCLTLTKKSLYEITDEDRKKCEEFMKKLEKL